MDIFGLLAILMAILILPFVVKAIEHDIELFFFVMGVLAVTVTARWSFHLVKHALTEPLLISAAVLIFGIVFRETKKYLQTLQQKIIGAVGLRCFVFFLIAFVGLTASFFTAIIVSLFLVEMISLLQVERKQEIRTTVLACFAIGLGAALTPVGEPLSTIAVSKMDGDFWYLLRLLGVWIVPGIIGLAVLGLVGPVTVVATENTRQTEHRDRGLLAASIRQASLQIGQFEESTVGIFLRALKVYVFVLALVLLGDGFTPLIERYVIQLSWPALYWLNTISAVLDNATLAAAELSPAMQAAQVRAILLGLLLAGGIFIPGNIPNIIAAGMLRISMKEWAVWGLALGLPLLIIYFLFLVF